MSRESLTAVSAELISELRRAVAGQVIAPDEAGYDEARAVFYGKFDSRPAVIVRPSYAADVALVVGVARERGLALAVRSGGHSVGGYSTTDGGILLDLRLMKRLEIDVEGQTAWAEAGLTAGEYTKAAGAHGLATGFGDTPSVGLGGLTLGGGVGYLVRKFGLTIDNLLAAEIVTADGEIRHVDSATHPDLFWAIRGGGGNFGVVTRFQYRLHAVGTIVGGMMILPATPDILTRFISAAEAAPDELSTIANLMVAPAMPGLPDEHVGTLIIMALMAFSGDVSDGERIMAPFRALGPVTDMVRAIPYPEIFKLMDMEDGSGPPQEVARSLFLDHIDLHTAETVVRAVQASTALYAVAQFRVLGGAMARVPSDATAYAHRDSRIMATIGAVYEDGAKTPHHEAWLDGFVAALGHKTSGVYVNFLGDEGEARVREAYPDATWERLAAVKAKYDPTNLFRRNVNIAPAVSHTEP